MRTSFMNLWITLLFISLEDLSVVSTNKCLPGYHGSLCNMPCRFPNYGKGCLCEEEQCDHITGCVWNKATDVMPVKDTPHFLLNATSVNNSSVEYDNSTVMPPNCSLHKDKGNSMLISLCILTATFFVIMSIYLKINKTNTHRIKYLRYYREQNGNTRNENSVL